MSIGPPFNKINNKLNIHKITRIVNEVFELYTEYGYKDYIGEDMTQLEHALQTANKAMENDYSDEIILGCFLHDIGHLIGLKECYDKMDNLGVYKHEIIGAKYLEERNFPKTVCDIVRNHVNAKRYLITTNIEYYHKLSIASQETLVYQGGKMTEKELKDFNKDPLKDVYIKIREWEDESKGIGDIDDSKGVGINNTIETYKKLCYKVLSKL